MSDALLAALIVGVPAGTIGGLHFLMYSRLGKIRDLLALISANMADSATYNRRTADESTTMNRHLAGIEAELHIIRGFAELAADDMPPVEHQAAGDEPASADTTPAVQP